MLKFENKHNTGLYLECASNIVVIAGHYDNSSQIYDTDDDNKTLYGYEIYQDDTDESIFRFKSFLSNITIGTLLRTEIGSSRIELVPDTVDSELFAMLKQSVTIVIRDGKYTSDQYLIDNTEGDNVINVFGAITRQYSTSAQVELYLTINFPEWINKGATLTLERFIDTVIGEETFTQVDTFPMIVTNLSYSVVDPFFIIDTDQIGLQKARRWIIRANDNQNHNGQILKNTIGGSVTIDIKEINNGDMVKCLDYNSIDDCGVLLYDKLYELKQGNVSFIEGTSIVNGKLTNFIDDFSPGCYVLIDDSEYLVKKVVSNVLLEIDGVFNKTMYGSEISLTSSMYDNTESIIYGVYDDSNDDSQSNFKNIMPIRGNHKIFYKFGTKEMTIRNTSGDTFKLKESLKGKTIYKLWVNGVLLLQDEYILDVDMTSVRILNGSKVRQFNNYCYIIYYDNSRQDTSITGEYIFLSYPGYKTSFMNRVEFLNSLYKLPYYFNFSEALSYNYYEFNDNKLDIVKRKKTDKKHSLTFSTHVSNSDVNIDDKIIIHDIHKILKQNQEFRLIRFNIDTGTFTIYNKCELNLPQSESIEDDVNIITYTIDFKDKLIFIDRLFGNGDWGRFGLFGLDLLGVY